MPMEQKKNTIQKISDKTIQFTKRYSQYPLMLLKNTFFTLKTFRKQYPKTVLLISSLSFLALTGSYLFYRKQNSFIYYPNMGFGKGCALNPRLLSHPSHRNMIADDIDIKTKDNIILRGWHIKKEGSDKLFVYFQGNAGNMGMRLPFFEDFMEKTNSQILVIGYRGYSDSQGTPSQTGLQIDSQAILKKAYQICSSRKLSLYIFGQSIGGAVSIYAAGLQQIKTKLSGVILQNTFTSTTEVITSMLPILRYFSFFIRSLNQNPWNSYAIIKKIKCPILFIKSLQDRLIPPTMTDRLREECNKAHIHNFVLEIPGADHNNVYGVDPVNYFEQINHFLMRASKL